MVNFYHCENLDYCLHLHCNTHNVSTDMSFGLLQVFPVKLGSQHRTPTEPFIYFMGVNCSNSINNHWRQHPTKHQLYGHLLPITKTIQVRRTRHAGHCWRSRDKLIGDVLLWTPTYGRAKAGWSAWTYVQQICQKQWTIGRNGERVSGISILEERDDDDDEEFFVIYL